MRAKIIQYNSNDGTGLAVADNRQIDFSIRQWRSAVAPAINKWVDVEFNDETGDLESIAMVSDEVLLQQKTAEIKAKLGNAGVILSGHGGNLGQNILASVGIPIAIACVLYFLASNAFDFFYFNHSAKSSIWVAIHSVSLSRDFFSVATLKKLLLIFSWFSFLIPVFWKKRYANLFLVFPFAFVIAISFDILQPYEHIYTTRGMTPDWRYMGFGFYVCVLATGFMAWCGLRNFHKNP